MLQRRAKKPKKEVRREKAWDDEKEEEEKDLSSDSLQTVTEHWPPCLQSKVQMTLQDNVLFAANLPTDNTFVCFDVVFVHPFASKLAHHV